MGRSGTRTHGHARPDTASPPRLASPQAGGGTRRCAAASHPTALSTGEGEFERVSPSRRVGRSGTGTHWHARPDTASPTAPRIAASRRWDSPLRGCVPPYGASRRLTRVSISVTAVRFAATAVNAIPTAVGRAPTPVISMLTAVRSYLTRVDSAATAVARVPTAAGALPTRVTGAVAVVTFILIRPGISPNVVSSVATAGGPMPSGLRHAPVPDAKRAAEAALSVTVSRSPLSA